MLNPMAIPGTRKSICTIGTRHGNRGYRGHVAIIDPAGGPDNWEGIHYLTGGDKKKHGEPFMDPYAVDADTFLVSTTGGRDGTGKLLVMDSKGNYEVICESPAGNFDIRSPQPLIPKEPALWKPSTVDLTQATGEVLLARAHVGRDMDGVEPGQVAKLLILEVLPLPTKGIGPKLHHGIDLNIRRVLGTVPVAQDGSAYFKAPAMRAIQMVALDKNDKAIKRMRSFMTVQPGSLNSCVGCHEQRTTTIEPARMGTLLATRHGPVDIEPIGGLPESGIIDFPRDVQPVLDKHCVSCHNYKRRKSDIVLEGGRTDDASLSYGPLRGRSGIKGSEGGDKPYKYGSAVSPLLKMLEKGHHDVKLSKEEMNLIRVWIDSGAFWAGHTVPAPGGRVIASDEKQKKKNFVEPNFDAAVLQKRCDRCHSPGPSNRRRLLRGEKFDFTHPQRSLLLLAPLSTEAGGLEKCKARKDQALQGAVFASTQDPDYQALLAQIKRAGKAIGADDPHWDGDFVSLPGWYYEMRRFDVLPADMPDKTPIDPFQVEQRYYRFFYPESPGGVGPKIPSARGGYPRP
jgi:hypothetical protein